VIARDGSIAAYSAAGRAYACSDRSGRRPYLGSLEDSGSSCDGYASRIRVKSPYVAWIDTDDCFANVSYYVRRRNVATGKKLTTLPTGDNPCGPPDTCGKAGIGPATQLKLGEQGTVAWIATNRATTQAVREVWKFDRAGRRRVARGPGIDRTYLVVRRGKLSWRQDGFVAEVELKSDDG